MSRKEQREKIIDKWLKNKGRLTSMVAKKRKMSRNMVKIIFDRINETFSTYQKLQTE